MSDIDAVGRLLTSAAEGMDEVDAVVAVAEDCLELQLADGGTVLVEFDDPSGRIVLMTELGVVPAGRQAAAFVTLLSYNSLWRETGGVRMALTAADEPVLMIADIFVFGLPDEILRRFILSFLEKRALWSVFVTTATETRVDPLSQSDTMIRI